MFFEDLPTINHEQIFLGVCPRMSFFLSQNKIAMLTLLPDGRNGLMPGSHLVTRSSKWHTDVTFFCFLFIVIVRVSDLTSRISANTERINNKIINTHNEIGAERTALNTIQATLFKTERTVQCFASEQDTVTTISKETEPLPPSSSVNIMSAWRYDLIDLTSISANTERINNEIINTHNEIDAARTALNTLQAKLIKTETVQCFASDQNTVTTISTETREQDTVTTISTETEPCDQSMQTPSIKDVITKIKEYCKDTELLMSVSSNNHQSPEPGKPGPWTWIDIFVGCMERASYKHLLEHFQVDTPVASLLHHTMRHLGGLWFDLSLLPLLHFYTTNDTTSH